MPTPKPVVLCILDGWGLSDVKAGNAPALAKHPKFRRDHARPPRPTVDPRQ